MRALIQRVSRADVRVEGAVLGEIGPGLLILVCAMQGDTPEQAERLATKIVKLRIFRDEAGKMNRSVLDVQGAALYEHFAGAVQAAGIPVAMGRFGADMQVSLTNDGPVTIWMET